MAVIDQVVTEKYAIYQGDCIEGVKQLPDKSIHFSVYSPPFCGLYNYSSDERDMSNCKDADEFYVHYEFLVKDLARVTMPGRLTAVHCMDIPRGGGLRDLPGDIIRLHEKNGWVYHARTAIWKEPLRTAIRTRSKGLTHRQIVKDSTECNNAGADYVVFFHREGANPVPVVHPRGLLKYAGEREIPLAFEVPTEGGGFMNISAERYLNDWDNPQTNKLAHWIWQQYASAFWDDIRQNRVLPYKAARDSEEEKHCHPLQLDVIERCIQLYSNKGENVLTPFMGVGSEVYGAVMSGRRGIGFELKASYFRQACKNIAAAMNPVVEQSAIEFDDSTDDETE